MARLGRVPAINDTVSVPTASLVVEALRGLAVGRVRLKPIPTAPEREQQ
jgi:hypothetical protein